MYSTSIKKLKLSNQAVGSLMLCLQNALYAATLNKPKEECDITSMLLNLELEETNDGLVVNNPPVLNIESNEEDE